MTKRIAIIQFPGTNREDESIRAIAAAGLEPVLVRWNNTGDLASFDGYFLPGGWSYEDRIRSGVIAAKDPLMKIIKAAANKGKPVIGICNGAQILVEAGMIPGIENRVEMALAPNRTGFWCFWTHLHCSAPQGRSVFNKLIHPGEIMSVPIAHGEGRFVTKNPAVITSLRKNNQIIFQYCDARGIITDAFPTNPNGAILNIAGLCNPAGNVLAMMPHPEVASFKKQLPGFHGTFEQGEQLAPAHLIFQSLADFLRSKP
ncbi:phosphoribosylformylglycinamidine synthase I [Candidatus Woesearchaeota archaeon]|nr:phosphoribosylformylglycinamidine synthase I [Candidatus Woesearchaeota archaeon]